jgi:uncharacterized protein (TIGR02001 family)
MKVTFMKTLTASALLALPLLPSAQPTANVSLTSSYKFRGQDQDMLKTNSDTAFKPAVQGGFDYAFGDSGWYIGNWNSSVSWLAGNSIEMDFYSGYKFSYRDITFDVGGLWYAYPGNTLGNTFELYGSATYGLFTAKYSHTVSSDYFGLAGAAAGSGNKGRDTGYLSLVLAKEIVPKLTLKGALGFTFFADGIKTQNPGIPNYMDYSLGGSYDFGSGVSLSAAVAGAKKRSYAAFDIPNKPRLILTLTKSM